MMKWKFTYLVLLTITFATLNVSAQFTHTNYYVSDASGNDANGGFLPNNAFKTLRKAVSEMRQSSAQVINIVVEKGTYYPFDENAAIDPDASFLFFRNENNQAGKTLRILGGYDFSGGAFTRDIVHNPTYLRGTGDQGSVNHVVVIGNVNTTADSLVVEGFTIDGGLTTTTGSVDYTPALAVDRTQGGGMVIQNCDNNKIAIRNCVFANNLSLEGGGLYCNASTGLVFENCVFDRNMAVLNEDFPQSSFGGAAKIGGSSVTFLQCAFYRNKGNFGSAIYQVSTGQTAKITNCTFVLNDLYQFIDVSAAAAIFTSIGRIELTNSIVWGKGGLRLAGTLAQPGNSSSGDVFVSNMVCSESSDAQFATGPMHLLAFTGLTSPVSNPFDGQGTDKLWMTADDGLHLNICLEDNPALDAGNNSYWQASRTADITGNARIMFSTIDIGAYENDVAIRPYWIDNDGDGFGEESNQTILTRCPPAGYADRPGDCNDNDPAIHGQATEICDGKDNDCNGQIDDILSGTHYYPDNDGDGHGDRNFSGNVFCPLPNYVTSRDDCNDNDNTIYFNAPELCDGKDNNCDGNIDDHIMLQYFIDADGDGYGSGSGVLSCSPIAGRVTQSGDCDDDDNTIYPGAPELCDGKNNNCDPYIDNGQQVKHYRDADNDGYGNPTNFIMSCPAVAGRVLVGGDCNDDDNTIFPGVGGCAALPLTLVDFTLKEEDKKAIASWTTTDEVNTHHFELERSADGNQFQTIATVDAMNAPGDHNYNYVDAQPLRGKNYYRIKMVDIDDTYTYSRIASLTGNEGRAIAAIYPNPANDIVNVVIAESSTNLSIQLISLDGKVLQTKRFALRGTYQLNVTKHPAGIYFIKVSNGEIHKLVKQ